ncbi:MAG: DUF3333 domain-containing protein, partial [Pseudomonadota bacterium]
MTDATVPAARPSLLGDDARTKRRQASEKRFQAYGLVAICIGLAMLIFLVWTIVGSGWNAFFQTRLNVSVP